MHRAIYPNETVGAVPVCPPERLHSGVSIPKIHAWCAGDERWMRPCRATRAGTQAPPLPISIIIFHAIPCKQNNHLCAIHPNGANHSTQSTQTTSTVPRAIYPNETVGAVPVCPPERPRSGVSIPKTHIFCAGILTMDAPPQGDAGGHTGTAPTNLHHNFPRNPTQIK